MLSVGYQLLCLQGGGREGGGGVLFATQAEADEALISGIFPRGMGILKRAVFGEEAGEREGGRGGGWEEVRKLERVWKAYDGGEREEEGGEGGRERRRALAEELLEAQRGVKDAFAKKEVIGGGGGGGP